MSESKEWRFCCYYWQFAFATCPVCKRKIADVLKHRVKVCVTRKISKKEGE